MFEIVLIFIAITLITMGKPKEDNNPIINYLHDVPIRNTNTICLRVSEDAYRDLVEQSFKTGLSVSKIFVLRNEPCQSCGHDNVNISLVKKKYQYRIGENGNALVKTNNGKRHTETGQDEVAPAEPGSRLD